VDDARIEAAGCHPVGDFISVLPEMDAVTLHCPFTEETQAMIGERALGAMKPSAFLINTARGGIVDEDALHEALTTNAVAGAGLDVFSDEPAAADNPLFRLENLIVSPHIAGVTTEASVRMAVRAARNALAALDGELDPEFVVNREVL
jgi:D-3-phosphoglycerate dehydrogenase